MRKKLFILLTMLLAAGAKAQTLPPVGVYEAKDKISGLNRMGYLEINLDDSIVPDFSQQFEKDKVYKFRILPDNFFKKISTTFQGQNASGFVKYQSKMLISNAETCKLTDPKQGDNCWTLNWENDLGKNGKCTLYAPTDSTLLFIGLTSFPQSIGPDSLLFTLNKEMTASKGYLARKSLPQPPEQSEEETSDTPENSGSSDSSSSSSGSGPADIPKALQEWQPTVPQELQIPAANSGVIKGIWLGRNSNDSRILIRLNSTAKTFHYYGNSYYGIIKMDGPTYIDEGVIRIQELGNNQYALYTRPLDTDVYEVHYSVVSPYYNNLMFYPTRATPGHTQMGQPSPVSQKIYCLAQGNFMGMFTTGKEVSNFPLNLFQKSYFKNSMGQSELSYGFIPTSFNMGSRIDNDEIISTEPLDEKRIKIKYVCGRTGNVYTAILVDDPKTKSFSVTQTKIIKSESEFPDSDDCYLPNSVVKYVGPIKEE